MVYRWAQPSGGAVLLHEQAFPQDRLTHDSVVVRPLYAGICRADVKEVAGSRDLLPSQHQLFGHELIGEVDFAGASTGFHQRQLVTLNPNIDCERTTAFGNVMLVRASRETLAEALIPVPDGTPVDPPWLPEPFACVIHAVDVLTAATDLSGADIAIVGAGNAGILFAWCAADLRARVTLLNRSPARREFAATFPPLATHAIKRLDSPASDQFDIVILATTILTADVLHLGVRLTRHDGLLLMYGGTRSGFCHYGHDLNSVRRASGIVNAFSESKHVRIAGSYGCAHRDFIKAFELFRDRPAAFPLPHLITGRISIDDLPKAIEGMVSGEFDPPGKVLVLPSAR